MTPIAWFLVVLSSALAARAERKAGASLASFDKEEPLGCAEEHGFGDSVRGKRIRSKPTSLPFPPDWTEEEEEEAESVERRREKRDNVTQTTEESKKTSRSPEEKTTEKSCEEYEEEDEDFERELEEYEEMERRRRKKKRRRRRRHWSKWSEWSPCSVTCGKGRKIRWRRCIAKKCPTGELEMGEKTCQLPACSLLDKLFSFFK